MAEAVDLYHIKTHYFTSHPKLNYYAVVPVSLTARKPLNPHVHACLQASAKKLATPAGWPC